MKINLVNLAKGVFKNKEIIIENLSDNKMKIWYKAPHVTNLKPFVFPEFIELDEEFVEAIGLYVGDGKLTKNDMRHTEFTTIDKDIATFFLQFLQKRFNIDPNNIYIRIRYSKGNVEELIHKQEIVGL